MIGTLEFSRGPSRSLYLPERGVLVELPSTCAQGVAVCPKTGNVTVDPMDRAHLKAIMDDAILAKRYPSTEHGEKFMDRVSPQWRNRLLEKAGVVTEAIIKACFLVDKKQVVILLYGSLAKNLAKKRTDEDPSNIDIAVIGGFDWSEKMQVLGLIRPVRELVTAQVKNCEQCRDGTSGCPCQSWPSYKYQSQNEINIPNENLPIDRVNVIIQTPEIVRQQGYGVARNYVASCAKVLYDPEDLWKKIENETIAYVQLSPSIRRGIRTGRNVQVVLEDTYSSWRDSTRFQADSGVIDRVENSLRQNP